MVVPRAPLNGKGGWVKRDDPVERIVEMTVATMFAASAEMMRPMLREFALDLWRRWHEHYAGQRVPKGTRHHAARRNDRIREAARTGAPPDQLARDFYLSEAWVRHILENRRESH